MSMLQEFFYEGIIPIEEPVSDHEEYSQTIKEVSRLRAELEKRLNEDDKRLFEELMQEYAKLTLMQEMSRFLYGWRLGSKFTLETFQ